MLAAAVETAPMRMDDAVAAGLLEPAAAAAAARALVADGRLVELGDGWLMTAPAYRAAVESARRLLDERAAASPLAPGVPAAAVTGRGAHADALFGRLERDGVVERVGAEAVAPGTRASSVTAAADAERLLAALAADPRLDVAFAEVGTDAATGRALVGVLEAEGRLVRLPDGLAVPKETYAEALRIVIEGCRADGRFTLAELRDATGTSRRYAQALLERMDADGITRRVDDYRVLRRRAAAEP